MGGGGGGDVGGDTGVVGGGGGVGVVGVVEVVGVAGVVVGVVVGGGGGGGVAFSRPTTTVTVEPGLVWLPPKGRWSITMPSCAGSEVVCFCTVVRKPDLYVACAESWSRPVTSSTVDSWGPFDTVRITVEPLG